MSRQKLRIHQTQLDNLVSNLRGEIGEITTTCLVWCSFRTQELRLQTPDLVADMQNPDLRMISFLVDKLRDDLVARLSELGEDKIGRLNFHFLAKKLPAFQNLAIEYGRYIEKSRIREKRNQDVSHKELPERWEDHRYLHIPDRVILHAVALARRLMKGIDRTTLGPSAVFFWHEERRRRLDFTMPAHAKYMILPHVRLPGPVRVQIVASELAQGESVWSEMPTTVNGKPIVVAVSKKWGVLNCGGMVIALDHYPVTDVKGIEIGGIDGDSSGGAA